MLDIVSKIRNLPGMEEYNKYFAFNKNKTIREEDYTMYGLAQHNKDMDIEATNLGLEALLENSKKRQVMYSVYSTEEDSKGDVKIFFFPSKVKSDKPFMIVCAGGAYQYLVNGKEGFPVAARFAELGINAFVLNYRVNQDGEVDKALEDLESAVKFITGHKEVFGIENSDYFLTGFSAGAHLVSQFCVKGVGYDARGLKAPKGIVPVYVPAGDMSDGKIAMFLRLIHGSLFTEERAVRYDILSHVDKDHPATYLVHAVDDPLVPFENSVKYKEALDKAGVRNFLLESPDGGHGFGYGNSTSIKGWVDKACEFLVQE